MRWIAGGLRVFAVVVIAWLTTPATGAQEGSAVHPVRKAPVEALTVNPGFRDWSPTAVAGATIVGGNQTGKGGLVAVDARTGKVKWTYRPVFKSGTASLSTPPAIAGDLVVASFAAANPGMVAAVSLTTGKEVWRGPDPAVDAAVAVDGPMAYVLGKDGGVHAMDLATGRERWGVALSASQALCASRPLVRDNTVYITGAAAATPGNASRPAGYYLFALDSQTGAERWRYRAEAPYVHPGVCLRQPVLSGDTIFATGDNYLYAINRASGRDRWPAVEVRGTVDGRMRAVEAFGLVDAGAVVVAMTSSSLVAFDKATGRTVWDLAGDYNTTSPATAVAGDVLYFQGSPKVKPAAAARGTLHALDLTTREILWSFTRPTVEANWSFGTVTPVDGALWVDSYQALVKLQ